MKKMTERKRKTNNDNEFMVKVMAHLNKLHNRIPSEGSTHSMV